MNQLTNKSIDAVRGPWVAVLATGYGDIYDSPDDVEANEHVEVAVVRRSAAPVGDRRPGSYASDDVLYERDYFDSDEDLAMQWERAKAIAAALNASAEGGTRDEQ